MLISLRHKKEFELCSVKFGPFFFPSLFFQWLAFIPVIEAARLVITKA